MGLIIENDHWLLSETSNEQEFITTLDTAGTFVDRNIKIVVNSAPGNVTIENKDVEVIPAISEYPVDGCYRITVSNQIEVNPDVKEGWISAVQAGVITLTGVLELQETKLNATLVSSETDPSGYSAYDVTATSGYNRDNLTKKFDVYQGYYDN